MSSLIKALSIFVYKYRLLIIPLFLIIIYFSLYKIYVPKSNAFGCFDDCFNITAGYFITKGKVLYEQIPFNHQRLMADTSALIQSFSSPINIFELILRHRQFLLIFSFVMNLLLIFRFGLAALGFVLFYEYSKFYIFGDRFLAEGFIVYPLVYLTGLLWYKLSKKIIHNFDYILASIFTWFVIFAREPFVPLAIFLYIFIMWGKPFGKFKRISILIISLLTIATFYRISLSEYIYDVWYVNKNGILSSEIGAQSLQVWFFKSFMYPFYLFFGGNWNIFRRFIVSQDLVFLALSLFLILERKFKLVIITFVVLGIANIRYITPGTIFYSSFHMVPWYGMFLMFTSLMLAQRLRVNIKRFIFFPLVLFLSLGFLIFSPNSFIREKVNTHEEFITNYGNYLQVGEAIRLFSSPGDTLFVDGFDELIYWQAKMPSSYKYNWYTSFMPNFSKFASEREKMFSTNPPSFYYGSCPKDKNPSRLMPQSAIKNYTRLTSEGKPTCVFVRNSKVSQISDAQWKKASEFLFDKPPEL